ncbi:MAG: cupin domain-containing protein [Spirochaetia bacterium]|nr:cupin domain-containing protein [Spirochaetia bacterium]
MLEKLYTYATNNEKHIEKIVDDDVVMINHMVLPTGESVPSHYADSHVHMIIARGTLTLELNDQEPHTYPRGSIVNVPYHTYMKIRNESDETTEFFVVKTPSPRVYKKN